MGRLIRCDDCGHEISKNARACPKCGAPQKKRTSPITKLLAYIMFGSLGISIFAMIKSQSLSSSNSAGSTTTQASPQQFSSNKEMFLADKGKALAWMEADKSSIEEMLKDADSAEFRDVVISFYSDSPVTCGQVNAKNSFGGYAGFKDFVAGKSAGIRVIRGDGQMKDSEFDKVWNAACQDPVRF